MGWCYYLSYSASRAALVMRSRTRMRSTLRLQSDAGIGTMNTSTGERVYRLVYCSLS